MLKMLHLIIWIALWIGIGDALVNTIIDLRGSAIGAHRSGQISFEKFSRMLTGRDSIGGEHPRVDRSRDNIRSNKQTK